MNRPHPDEYPAFYHGYIATVGEDVIAELNEQLERFCLSMSNAPAVSHNYTYAEGKWTLKEVIGHIIDTERIMLYRLLCISRGEKNTLPGFDENAYIQESTYSSREMADLIEEFRHLRLSGIALIRSVTPDQERRQGVANGMPVSVRALIYIVAGHMNHHAKIITERYF